MVNSLISAKSIGDILDTSLFTQYNFGEIAVSLAVAFVLGLFIYMVYTHFYAGVIYSRSFAVTIIGMCILTCMVTLAISTNVVLSLGMVGALSIVRYRTAIKDPIDLLYLFWAITTGITTGAQMFVLALVSGAVMTLVIYIFYHRSAGGEVYVAVIHYEGDTTGDEILKTFGKIKYFIKSKTMRGHTVEMAIEVYVKNHDLFFEEKIRDIEGVKDITLIQYNGEYHG